MEGNELNVFTQTHCIENEKDDSVSDNIPRNNKSGFRHFVEESTLRNVSLDGLDELSEVGCSTSDRNLRRTPSSVSSEAPILRRGFIVETNEDYRDSTEFLARIAYTIFILGSLGTICNSGTVTTDVFDYPMNSYIRAHLFVLVFAVLVNTSFFIIGSTSLIDIFPPSLAKIDGLIHFIICIALFTTSGLMFRFGYVNFREKLQHLEDSDIYWAMTHSVVSAIFGIIAALDAFALALVRGCKPSDEITMAMTDEIALTSIHSS